MQLIALDDDSNIILAVDAKKGRDYFCPECKKKVRIRKGLTKRPHFFHHTPRTPCRHIKKSWTHLQIQLHLLKILPKGEATLEKFFPSIQRIADVAWETQGIVFEVQCSPINLDLCHERNEAYKSIGLTPVWILHEHRFNRRNLTAAENYLRRSLTFYSHINAKGEIFIYDQHEILRDSKRHYRSRPVLVNLTAPFTQEGKMTFEGALPERIKEYPGLYDLPSQRRWCLPRTLKKWMQLYQSILQLLLKKHAS